MVQTATARFVRISPYKVRRVANEIKKKRVIDAFAYLSVLTNKGALVLKKLLNSARTALLSKDSTIDENNIFIKNIYVDGGPTLKRYHPISRGRASRILKRMCHIKVEIENL